VAVEHGETAEGLAWAEKLLVALESKGLWTPVARTLPAVTQLLLRTGQQSTVGTLVERCNREFADLDAPLAPAALRCAQGFVSSGARDWPTAAREFLAAATLYESLECPHEAAQAREQAAEALFQAGE
jgi:hypothetical protein